ncbi:MAG TPA: HD domain-containing phosphohydrolase [Dissulfurispiraceae bacterium]|nr:HD domain-containing phosphohydrolase [Dissulfurispiraceae bacterium]
MTSELNTAKLAVLFVDDEQNVLKSLTRLFLDEPFTILTAGSGPEGLEILKEHPVAVIISDQMMPGMIGAEFLAKSQKMQPDAVRMILTGYADVSAAMDAINKGGAFRYITKPWNDDDLVHAVHDALERYRLAAENRRLTALTIQQNEELRKWGEELEMYVQQQTIDLSKRNKELEQLTVKLKKNFHDMITAFLKIMELRDHLLYRHSIQVAALVEGMGKAMGLKAESLDLLVVAAQMHDIGSLKSPDMSLLKDMKEMSPEEQQEYAVHPVRGQSVLAVIDDLKQVGLWIRNHHEWYNGRGFPDRLQGEAIPLGARVIAAADAFDWMMCRGGHARDAVAGMLEKIRPLFGVRLDPRLFEALKSAAASVYTADADKGQDIVIELPLEKLAVGMVLARDIRSGSNLLLLGKGAVLSQKALDGLLRYHAVDPLKEKIAILTKVKPA